jgi:hypothetical protein
VRRGLRERYGKFILSRDGTGFILGLRLQTSSRVMNVLLIRNE